MIFASDGCVKVGNPGIDITAVIEDAILNAEDAVGLDALRRVQSLKLLKRFAFETSPQLNWSYIWTEFEIYLDSRCFHL